jgi:hypothetical protein
MKIRFWDEWRGSLDGRPTMWIKHLLSHKGFKVDLHKFVKADDKECFHTHPAKSIRVILWGGYFEELETGEIKIWLPFMFGRVAPRLSHRIAGLVFKRSYSLWIRWPKTHDIELNGTGWPPKEEV